MADTPSGETGTQGNLENNAKNEGASQDVNTSDGEVEKLRKQLKQQEMRSNQLANELEAKKEADRKKEAEELEKKEQFKTLYESTQEELDAIKAEQEAKERRESLSKASEEILGEYPEEVKAIVEETGLSLSDDSDEGKEIFKAKLEKINATVGKQKVSPNNPRPVPTSKFSIENEDGIIEAPVKGDRFDQLIKSKPGISSMLSENK